MESNLHLQIKCAPPRASRPLALIGLSESSGPPRRAAGGGEGWIIVMKRRWTGWLPRAARVKSSGGFCCVNCALVIHCSPPFHAVSRYRRPPEILAALCLSPPSCAAGTKQLLLPLRQTINGLFAENGMATDYFGEDKRPSLIVSPLEYIALY